MSARQLRPPERRLVEFGNAVRDHHPDSGAPHRREIDHIVPHVQTLLRGEPLLPQHAFKRLEFVFAVFVDESEPELRGTHPVRFRCAPGEQPDFDPLPHRHLHPVTVAQMKKFDLILSAEAGAAIGQDPVHIKCKGLDFPRNLFEISLSHLAPPL